jgi:hypothetical protein
MIRSDWRSWRRPPELGIEAGLLRMVTEIGGLPKGEVNLQSRLLHDLGIAGTEAAELLFAFSREFVVDMTEFKFEEYFPNQAVPGMRSVRDFIRTLKDLGGEQPFAECPAISVADLAAMAKSGRWVRTS